MKFFAKFCKESFRSYRMCLFTHVLRTYTTRTYWMCCTKIHEKRKVDFSNKFIPLGKSWRHIERIRNINWISKNRKFSHLLLLPIWLHIAPLLHWSTRPLFKHCTMKNHFNFFPISIPPLFRQLFSSSLFLCVSNRVRVVVIKVRAKLTESWKRLPL